MAYSIFTAETDGHGFSIIASPDLNPEQTGDHFTYNAKTEAAIRQYLESLGLNSDEPIMDIAVQLLPEIDNPLDWLIECTYGYEFHPAFSQC